MCYDLHNKDDFSKRCLENNKQGTNTIWSICKHYIVSL